ncbi:MAG: hypothetical protein J6J79_03120 [Lachnospiraceae bacterium]|nr:hypothetical protein [Lachnospiraceae bacterium]
MRRRRKPMKAITMLQIGMAGVLLICLVLLMVWYTDGLTSFKPNAGTYQYVAGLKIDYKDNAVYRSKDGKVEVSDKETSGETAGAPILYEGERKITLSNNMLLMVPKQGTALKKVNCFTTITERDGLSTLTLDKKKAQVFGGFLYDGEDTYIFLEKTTLAIGAKTVELDPLSYATVNYQQHVEYHNSADNKHELIALANTDVTAKAESGYVIDLGKDTIEMGQGEAILYSAVETVANIDMEK